MDELDAIPEPRNRRAKTLAMATLAGATVGALTLPSVAQADPGPPPPPHPPPSGNHLLAGPPRRPHRAAPPRRGAAATGRSQRGPATGRSQRAPRGSQRSTGAAAGTG